MNSPDHDPTLQIDCRAVQAKLAAGEEFLLLDCRERDEYDLVHLPPARLLPMSELPDRLQELAPYRDAQIIVHCHLGMRSEQLAAWFHQQGFSNVRSMTGGIDRWSVEIDPTLPRY